MAPKASSKPNLLGGFLQKKRLALGLSQGQVAARLRYTSPQYISNWERGISAPPLDKIPDLLILYKISKKEMIEVMTEHTRINLEKRLNALSSKKEEIA